MKFSRIWAMPSSETFSIPPIAELLRWHLRDCKVVVDPFARNNRFGTLTNDLNPDTAAQDHMDAVDWLKGLVERGVRADAVLFDPPYSPRQIMECYQGIGRKMTQTDAHHSAAWHEIKTAIDELTGPGAKVICCGWNSQGIARSGYVLEELLLVTHGSCHNDTIVTVERKVQAGLFAAVEQRSTRTRCEDVSGD